jgi:DNA-directed RNA polymerase III subunit RPC6
MSGKKRPAAGASSNKKGGGGKKIKIGASVGPATTADVRIKTEESTTTTGAAVGGGSNTGNPLKNSVRERFIALLKDPKNNGGVSNRDAQSEFSKPEEKTYLVEVINELSQQSKLHMSRSEIDNDLYYQLLADEVAAKYAGLDLSAKLVLQVIEKSGTSGIWTKDIRLQTNIQQQALNKIFKQLETRHLIKPVKSVTAKAKKLYMLYELTPSKEITGGVWYSGLEFDHEFIAELRSFVMHCIRRLNNGNGVTLTEIKNTMVQSKVSRVELSSSELKQLVQTLIYDYHIEEDSISLDGESRYIACRRLHTAKCDFKWWDALSPDFHFRAIKFEDGVVLGPHEPHHHTA